MSAARSVLNDWNTGKIKYCTQPPEIIDNTNVHISATIVHSEAREFDVHNFESMETDLLNQCPEKSDDVMEITSTGPLELRSTPEETQIAAAEITESETPLKGRKRKLDDNKKDKPDPVLLLEGISLNTILLVIYIINNIFSRESIP